MKRRRAADLPSLRCTPRSATLIAIAPVTTTAVRKAIEKEARVAVGLHQRLGALCGTQTRRRVKAGIEKSKRPKKEV